MRNKKNIKSKHLLIIIPAFNEENNIEKVIMRIPRNIEGFKTKILVVDDGSTDRTSYIAKVAGANYVIKHSKNIGVGGAFRTGIKLSLKLQPDVIITIDADGQFDPIEIPKLLKPIVRGQADYVIGSRFLAKRKIPNMPKIKKIGNYVVTLLVSFLSWKKFTDTQSGFRAFTINVAKHFDLRSIPDFTYTQVTLLQIARKRKFRIKEIPVSVRYMKNRKSRVVKSIFHYSIRVTAILLLYILKLLQKLNTMNN